MSCRCTDDPSGIAQLPLPALWLDPEGRIGLLNARARLLLNVAAAETAPLEPATATPVWLQDELARFSDLAELEYNFERELVAGHTLRWFNILVRRMAGVPGDSAGTMVLFIDITAQKSLEKLLHQIRGDLEAEVAGRTTELARANASLRGYIEECKRSSVALQKLSSAVEQTADHVIITDRNGVIEYVNPAFEKLTGFSNAEVLGQTPRLLKSGQHPPKFFQKLWETILAGTVFRADFINRKKNGELYTEEKTIAPIKDDHGRITHFVSVGRNVAGPRQPEAGSTAIASNPNLTVKEL
jgi:PAS domain S-box-containing protein